MTITSAGCNALDYALLGLERVDAVDVNPRQNALLELKIAGVRRLEFEDFFALFGRGRLPNVRPIYEGQLRQALSPWSQKYWDRWIKFFDHPHRSFYFRGASGTFARLIKFCIDRVVKARSEVNAMLEAATLQEQQEIYHRRLRERFWTRPLRFAMNRDATWSMVGVPRAQRRQLEADYEGGVVQFVRDCLDAVFGQLPLTDNYFWRVYITGGYTPGCCPEHLKPNNFQRLKAGLVDCIHVHTDTLQGFLEKRREEVSRFVLLAHFGQRIADLAKVYVVDLCPSLLAVARQRVQRHGWTNVELVEADVTSLHPAEPSVDVVTFSYSLTMVAKEVVMTSLEAVLSPHKVLYLANVALAALLACGAALSAALLFRRGSAPTRSGLLLVGLVLTLTSPALAWLASQTRMGMLQIGGRETISVHPAELPNTRIESPFSAVVAQIRERHGISIRIDEQKWLADLGIERTDLPVTRKLDGLSLHSVLQLVLSDLASAYVIRDDTLVITSEKESRRLAQQGVIHADDVKRELERSPAFRRKKAKIVSDLEDLTQIEFRATPLGKAIDSIQKRHGIAIEIDVRELDNVGIRDDVPCTLSVKGVKLATALDKLLGDLGLTYVVENEYILIRPAKISGNGTS